MFYFPGFHNWWGGWNGFILSCLSRRKPKVWYSKDHTQCLNIPLWTLPDHTTYRWHILCLCVHNLPLYAFIITSITQFPYVLFLKYFLYIWFSTRLWVFQWSDYLLFNLFVSPAWCLAYNRHLINVCWTNPGHETRS